MPTVSMPQRWSKDVRTHYHPPPGLFANGSAKTIAATLLREAPSEAIAMDRLNFYINRAGSNLTVERRRVLENAKRYLKLRAGRSMGSRRIDPVTYVVVEVGRRDVHTRILREANVYLVERESYGAFAGFVTIGTIDATGRIEQIGSSDVDRKVLYALQKFLAARGAF
jgi:hypothetical protein